MPRYSCQCRRPPGPYGDGLLHYCYADITAEDLLCDACRIGCTVLWTNQADEAALRAFPLHAEYPRIVHDAGYLDDLMRRAPVPENRWARLQRELAQERNDMSDKAPKNGNGRSPRGGSPGKGGKDGGGAGTNGHGNSDRGGSAQGRGPGGHPPSPRPPAPPTPSSSD